MAGRSSQREIELKVKDNDEESDNMDQQHDQANSSESIDENVNANEENEQEDNAQQNVITEETIASLSRRELRKLLKDRGNITFPKTPTTETLLSVAATTFKLNLKKLLEDAGLLDTESEEDQDNSDNEENSPNPNVEEKQNDDKEEIKKLRQKIAELEAKEKAEKERGGSAPLPHSRLNSAALEFQPQGLNFIPRENTFPSRGTAIPMRNSREKEMMQLEIKKQLFKNAKISIKLKGISNWDEWWNKAERTLENLDIPVVMRYEYLIDALETTPLLVANEEKDQYGITFYQSKEDSDREAYIARIVLRLKKRFSDALNEVKKYSREFKKFVWRGTNNTYIKDKEVSMQEFLFQFRLTIKKYERSLVFAQEICDASENFEVLDERKQFLQLWSRMSKRCKDEVKTRASVQEYPTDIHEAFRTMDKYAIWENEDELQRIQTKEAFGLSDRDDYRDSRNPRSLGGFGRGRIHFRGRGKGRRYRGKQRNYNKTKDDYDCTICQMDGHSTYDCYFNEKNPRNKLKDPEQVKLWLEKKQRRLERRKERYARNSRHGKNDDKSRKGKDKKSQRKREMNNLETIHEEKEEKEDNIHAQMNSLDLDIAECAKELERMTAEPTLCGLSVLDMYPETDSETEDYSDNIIMKTLLVDKKKHKRSVSQVLSDISDTDSRKNSHQSSRREEKTHEETSDGSETEQQSSADEAAGNTSAESVTGSDNDNTNGSNTDNEDNRRSDSGDEQQNNKNKADDDTEETTSDNSEDDKRRKQKKRKNKKKKNKKLKRHQQKKQNKKLRKKNKQIKNKSSSDVSTGTGSTSEEESYDNKKNSKKNKRKTSRRNYTGDITLKSITC